jgi:hypothetical protein
MSFSFSNLLRNYASMGVPFTNVHAVEMVDYLVGNFRMEFNDFLSKLKLQLRDFETPFTVQVSDPSEKLQLG